ncbi:hypothetical protein GGI07_004750 [Coemansia sp. Benny D115]|nr:hypothetical protein GGI07_004750 [Coemansia sp. Benny D115]
MGKKFAVNRKAEEAKERKQGAKDERNAQEQRRKEQKEAEAWRAGAKDDSKRENAEAKRLAKLAEKEAAKKLLEEEEKRIAKESKGKGSNPKLTSSLPARRAPVLRGAEKKAAEREAAVERDGQANRAVETFAASNIDDALDLLDNINAGGQAAATIDGSQAKKGGVAAAVDRHPERRAKAAYKAFEDREYMRIKEENPGLRMSQIKDLIWKAWQKSPENPLNQVQVAHNATQAEIDEVVEQQRRAVEDRLRIDG